METGKVLWQCYLIKGDISQTDRNYIYKNIYMHTVRKDTMMVAVT